MKKLLTNTLLLLITSLVLAQAPQQICYQAAAKDATGTDLISQSISIRASILKNNSAGPPEWIETHSVVTDAFGLFSINVGQGLYSGGNQTIFEEIDWGSGNYWLKIELDASGGQNYVFMGSSQMLSVPYALYAASAARAATALDDEDKDATNELQTLELQDGNLNLLDVNGNAVGTSIDLTPTITTIISDAGLDSDPMNELQTLSLVNNELTILDQTGNPVGGTIDMSIFNSLDNDPTNELQTLDYQNGELVLLSPDGTSVGDAIELDNSITNELQELTYIDGILGLTNSTIEISLLGNISTGVTGGSSDFPQGIVGDHIILTTGDYQVPNGKILWITAGNTSVTLTNIGPAPSVIHPTTPNMPVFPEGAVIQDCMCTGMLMDTTSVITPVIIDFMTQFNTYQVPDGKVLFIKSGLKNDQPGLLRVNGVDMTFLSPSFTRGTRIMSFPAETNIQAVPNAFGEVDVILTGYLLDSTGLTNPLLGN